MRLSNLLWIVALLIVWAVSTRPHPAMIGKRESPQAGGNADYDYVDGTLDEQLKRLGQYNLQSWDATSEDGGFQRVTQCDGLSPTTSCETHEATCSTTCSTTCQTPLPPSADCDRFSSNQNQANSQQSQQQQQQQQQPQQQQSPYSPQQQQQQQPQQQPQQQFELDDSELRGRELRKLVQHLYVAQARVQLEATEIHKAQAVASSAQAQLEDTANHVRTITATLHNAQQEVAAAAIRAQIAQLQLAAHDQLLFAARQDVDSLSSQVVGLQAAEGIVQPKLTVDLHALLDRLRQPLQHFDRPTPVPMIITPPPLNEELPHPQPQSDETTVNQKEVVKQQEQAKIANQAIYSL